jgi:hypothetical protein
MTHEKVNLREKLSLFYTHWDPTIVAELNGQYVKLVKFQGPFTWHKHEKEDEMFPVAEKEAHVLLFEPVATLNTGDAGGPLTRKELDRI